MIGRMLIHYRFYKDFHVTTCYIKTYEPEPQDLQKYYYNPFIHRPYHITN